MNRIAELERIVAQRDESIQKLNSQLSKTMSSSVGGEGPSTTSATAAPAVTAKGTLTASSSYNMLEALSDGKSEESAVVVGHEASSSSSDGSLSEFEANAMLSTAVRKPAVAANKSASALPATETQSKRVSLLEVSLEEEDEDGWT